MRRTMSDMLAASSFFGALPPTEVTALGERAVSLHVPAGQAVFAQGDPSDALYAVVSGRIRILRVSEEGDEVTLGLIDPGEIFGEIAVVDGGPRTASAVALEETRLGLIRRAAFLDFLTNHPEATIRLLSVLCERIRSTIDQVDSLAFHGLEARLARVLTSLSEAYGVPTEEGLRIDLRLGQRELGAFIAASREGVNKQLTLWREEGLVTRADGRLILRDPKRLAARARLGVSGI